MGWNYFPKKHRTWKICPPSPLISRSAYPIFKLVNLCGLSAGPRREFRVAIFDLSLPDLEGMELVREVNQSNPETAIIILTGYPTLESSIEALRQGAFDYLIKPFKVPEVIATIQKALNDHSLKAEITGLRSRVRELEQELRRYQEGAPMPPPGRPAGPGASPAAGGYGGFPRGPRTG